MSILISCTGFLILGIWRGEDLSADPLDWLSDAAFGVAWFALWLFVAWRKPGSRMKFAILAVFGPCVLAIGLYAGNQSARSAYNECVREGELVRKALSGFYKEHQFYPEDLDSLGMEKVPGGRVLRESVLWYVTSKSGYDLSFSDWLVSHEATESSPFKAHK
jgi:hypothetical protein